MFYKKFDYTKLFSIILVILVFLVPINFIQSQSLNFLPLFSEIITYAIRVMYILLIPLLWIYGLLNKKIKIDVYLILFLLSLSVIITTLFFPQNVPYLENVFISLIYSVSLYMLIRTGLFSFNQIKKILILSSRVLLVIIILLTLIFGGLISEDQYMSFSNALTIISLILLYNAISRKNIIDLLMSLFGIVLVFIFGSRGGFVAILMYLLILAIIFKRMRILFILGTLFFMFISIHIFGVQEEIMSLLQRFGIESRTFDFLLSNTLFYFDDRIRIYNTLFEEIFNNPLMGIGIAGDRYYLQLHFSGVNSTYAHNIFLEILLHYGLLLGSFIIGIVTYIICNTLIFNKRLDKYNKSFLYIFFVTSILQLFVSRSYLTEQNLFFFMAILVNLRKNQYLEIKNETYEYSIN